MSIETFFVALNVFGTWVTLLDPSDVPAGMSPNLSDVDFFPGECAHDLDLSRNMPPSPVRRKSTA